MRRLLLFLAVVALALARGSPALADVFHSTLNTGDAALSGFSAPFGEVSVNLTSPTTATITFTSDIVNGNIYLFGDGGSVAVNVNATTFTVSGISGSNSGTGFTPGPYTFAGSGNENGFGSFNLTINSFDGFTHSSDTITFTVTDTSGTWSSASEVLVANSSGFDAAAHTFVTSSPANAANGALATGFSAEGATVVPEPGSMALFGSGLLLLGGAVRRRWHSRQT